MFPEPEKCDTWREQENKKYTHNNNFSTQQKFYRHKKEEWNFLAD